MRNRLPALLERLHRTDGAQMVEFALILPVLLLIVFGIVNFGFVFGQKLSLNQAVREGARLAVVDKSATNVTITGYVQNATGGLISPQTAVLVESDVQNVNTAGGPFGSSGTADCEDYNKLGGQLRVRATYQASWLVPLPLGLTAPNLTSEAVFRCEVI